MLLFSPDFDAGDDAMPTLSEWTEFFSQSVRNLRAESGLSVQAAAEVWDVDERTYRKYEKGMAQPGVVDFAVALDRLDAPVMREILNFLHPDVYGAEPDSTEDMRSQLAYFFEHIASDRVTRQVYYNMLGQVADNVAPQLEMLSAIQHLPLLYRVMIVNNVLNLFEIAAGRGELVNTDQPMPDITALRAAAGAAEEACKQLRDGYHDIISDKTGGSK